MKISFFEEFPNNKNLKKLKLVDFKTTVFIAAKSLSDYKRFRSLAKEYNKDIECAYWPILEKDEGYWLSPFSDPAAVKRVINELKSFKGKILWDAELPLLKSSLFMRNLPYFFSNRKRIKNFVANAGNRLYVAEVPFLSWWLRLLGVSFKHGKRVPMYYVSIMPAARHALQRTNSKIVGIGLIAKGVGPTDKVYSASELGIDLGICKQRSVEEAIVFRLGGLNKRYLEIIKKYL
ncbi:hypothetical protein ACFL1B_05615 [Nanoarchaeota archaeon]